MAGKVKCDCAEFEISGAQRRDPRTEIVVAERFADIELVDLHTVHLVLLHRHLTSPSTLRVFVITDADELRMS